MPPQAADRLLLISEARPAGSPALRVPPGAAGGAGGGQGEDADAAAARPDLALQHVRLPQPYIEAAYPLVRVGECRVILDELRGPAAALPSLPATTAIPRLPGSHVQLSLHD